jgi:hypothetical protein
MRGNREQRHAQFLHFSKEGFGAKAGRWQPSICHARATAHVRHHQMLKGCECSGYTLVGEKVPVADGMEAICPDGQCAVAKKWANLHVHDQTAQMRCLMSALSATACAATAILVRNALQRTPARAPKTIGDKSSLNLPADIAHVYTEFAF